MNKVALPIFFAIFFMLTSCSKSQTGGADPKVRLRDYISQSFAVSGPEDREALSKFLTGQAKARLAAWSDEQFRAAFVENKRQFVNLVFSEVRTLSPGQINITYELTYFDQSKGHDAKVTQKKMAQLSQDREQWLIAEVRNIKELIEYKNEMALP
ncbi:MAG: hypothetical protein KGQ59_02285 [Bdellovibrionales bacterium]|nr:hypothetical protein [Bdellovibrionales bacterium]